VIAVEREMRDLAEMVRPVESLKVILGDPDDDRVLECAVAAGAEIIVSGDRHLLGLGIFRDIRILSPTDFLNELGREGDSGKEEPPTAHEPQAEYRVKNPSMRARVKKAPKRRKVKRK